MSTITAEEARIRVALSNPNLSADGVRREADNLIAKLDSIEAEDNLRAAFAAQQAEAEKQQAAEAQARAEAVNDAIAIVRASHPGWDDASVQMEAQRLAAENASAMAMLNLREAGNPFTAYALPAKDA